MMADGGEPAASRRAGAAMSPLCSGASRFGTGLVKPPAGEFPSQPPKENATTKPAAEPRKALRRRAEIDRTETGHYSESHRSSACRPVATTRTAATGDYAL